MARILIVDDSTTVALAVGMLLRAEGHEVETLSSIDQAPEYLKRNSPDLMLLDIEMPGLPAAGWARFVQQYAMGRTAIVIHSSRPFAEMDALARQVNAAGILPKDSSREVITFIVNSVLRRRERRSA